MGRMSWNSTVCKAYIAQQLNQENITLKMSNALCLVGTTELLSRKSNKIENWEAWLLIKKKKKKTNKKK